MPPKFKYFYKRFQNLTVKILDIGCGNNSPEITKYWFPNSIYHGIDIQSYIDQEQFIDKIFLVDLERNTLEDKITDSYDIIILSHVIEHIENGKQVVDFCCGRLKDNGHIYIEFPSVRSLNLPSAIGTLNFFDDPTHKKIYALNHIKKILIKHNIKIIKSGARRDLRRIIFTTIPSLVINGFRIITGKKIIAKGLWDIMGFADFIYGKK